MKPIITSEERFHIFPVMHGRDPRIYKAPRGSIMIDGEKVEINFQGSILLRWLATSKSKRLSDGLQFIILSLVVLYFSGFLFLLAMISAAASYAGWLLLGLFIIIAIFIYLSIWQHHLRLTRNDILKCERDGYRIELLFRDEIRPVQGLSFCVFNQEDAEAIEDAINLPDRPLSPPIFFTSTIGPDELPRTRQKRHPLFPFRGTGKLTMKSSGIELTGKVYQDASKREKPRYRLLVIGIMLLFVVAIVLIKYFFANRDEGWVAGIGLLFVMIGYYRLMTGLAENSYITISTEIPWEQIGKIKRGGSTLFIQVKDRESSTGHYSFSTFNEEDAEAIGTLLSQGSCEENLRSFTIIGTLSDSSPKQSFFGKGYLEIADGALILTGKHGKSDLRGRGFWLLACLLYAGCATLMFILYPVTLGPLLPTFSKGIVVICVPAFALICLAAIVIPLSPLFITRSITFSADEIYSVRRRWRQISLAVFARNSDPACYDFFTETESEAKAIEEALSNNG